MTNTPEIPSQEMPDEDRMRVYGDFMYLGFRSLHHNQMSVAGMRMAFEPPIEMGQFRIFRFDGVPRGLFTWAWLDDETAKSFVRGDLLEPNKWRSGDQLWIIDYIAPYRGMAGGMAKWMTTPGNLPRDRFWFRRHDTGDRLRQVTRVDLRDGKRTAKIVSEAEFLQK